MSTTSGLTDHQAKYFARALLRVGPAGETARIGSALMDAQVDLNPHQVEAALFAFQSPLSKGVILADEVGLGKTIEAGLVVTQRWAEGRRRILVIAPASLRKQWAQELAEKFFLPATILETKNFNAAQKAGHENPFEATCREPAVVICSYQFAARKADEMTAAHWDLAVLDEAHRLRNVYKPGAKTATAIRTALATTPKLLLTATPLQNSLMELYGLVSLIDQHHFGDTKSFKSQYARLAEGSGRFDDLKQRLAPVCHRTLRRQVAEYVSYTNRVPITQEFWPTDDEQALYDMVSDYLRRPELQALPASQRSLMVLVMRKLLASSTFAIAGALDSLARKLQGVLRDDDKAKAVLSGQLEEAFESDFENLPELTDEWSGSGATDKDGVGDEAPGRPLTDADRTAIAAEINELQTFRDLAVSITENAKGLSLLSALETGFAKAAELGAADKAVIFTESRRTQEYLVKLLSREGYDGQIALFNGSNNDAVSKATYQAWKERHAGTDMVSGSAAADMRAALVEKFQNDAKIMIATEAAAEGINLQFCSMVVNYDLPWNPQRIEQRIGRCHRYGQRHDVVVVNFLNQANAADQRVYELLDEKFRLFSGVFGSSDEVLGAVESGVDFERRIASIYQECRTEEAIEEQFNRLRQELDTEITATMDDTRRKLLENFDADVHDRLRVSLTESQDFLDVAETRLWQVTTHILDGTAAIDGPTRTFELAAAPPFAPGVDPGRYRLTRSKNDAAHRYRRNHPLAVAVLDRAANLEVPDAAELLFDYSAWPVRSEAIEPLVGRSGWLVVDHLQLRSEESEDHLAVTAQTDDGTTLHDDQARRLLEIPATTTFSDQRSLPESLADLAGARLAATLEEISIRQGQWFDEETEKLDRWAQDKRAGLKSQLQEYDDTLRAFARDKRAAASLPDKLAIEKKIKKVQSERDTAWRAYDAKARTVEDAKEALIDTVEARLAAEQSVERIIQVRFTVT